MRIEMYSIGLESAMKPYQYFLLSLTLIVFAVSLFGHFALETPICCCMDDNYADQEICEQSEADVCLVCQLQIGVYVQAVDSWLVVEKITVSNSDSSPPLEFVSQLLRPPILF